jgi:hypothetical protein
MLKHDQNISRARDDTRAFASGLSLPSKVMLLNKDSMKVDEITETRDSSVEHIITDPPYLRYSLDSFEGLTRFASASSKKEAASFFTMEISLSLRFMRYLNIC